MSLSFHRREGEKGSSLRIWHGDPEGFIRPCYKLLLERLQPSGQRLVSCHHSCCIALTHSLTHSKNDRKHNTRRLYGVFLCIEMVSSLHRRRLVINIGGQKCMENIFSYNILKNPLLFSKIFEDLFFSHQQL